MTEPILVARTFLSVSRLGTPRREELCLNEYVEPRPTGMSVPPNIGARSQTRSEGK